MYNESAMLEQMEMTNDIVWKITLGIKQNQSFNEFSIGGTPIVYHFVSPLVTKVLRPTDGENGIKPKLNN